MSTWRIAMAAVLVAAFVALVVLGGHEFQPAARDRHVDASPEPTVGPVIVIVNSDVRKDAQTLLDVTDLPTPTTTSRFYDSYDDAERDLGWRLLRSAVVQSVDVELEIIRAQGSAGRSRQLAVTPGGRFLIAQARADDAAAEADIDPLRHWFGSPERGETTGDVGPFHVTYQVAGDRVFASFETGAYQGSEPILATVEGPNVAATERFIAELTFRDVD